MSALHALCLFTSLEHTHRTNPYDADNGSPSIGKSTSPADTTTSCGIIVGVGGVVVIANGRLERCVPSVDVDVDVDC